MWRGQKQGLSCLREFMISLDLEITAQPLVAPGNGIRAGDESTNEMARRAELIPGHDD